MADWIDDEIKRHLKTAKAEGNAERAAYPHAVAARYDEKAERVVIDLENGTSFMFPPHLAQGLENASPADLAEIEVTPAGTGLLWPRLGAALSMQGLLLGVFGSNTWMGALGKRGGASKSSAKAAAARANGAKGGRPRKAA